MNIINPMSLDYTLINRFIDTSCARFHNNLKFSHVIDQTTIKDETRDREKTGNLKT